MPSENRIQYTAGTKKIPPDITRFQELIIFLETFRSASKQTFAWMSEALEGRKRSIRYSTLDSHGTRVAQPGHHARRCGAHSFPPTRAAPIRFLPNGTRHARKVSLRSPQEEVSLFTVRPQPKRRDRGCQGRTSTFSHTAFVRGTQDTLARVCVAMRIVKLPNVTFFMNLPRQFFFNPRNTEQKPDSLVGCQCANFCCACCQLRAITRILE